MPSIGSTTHKRGRSIRSESSSVSSDSQPASGSSAVRSLAKEGVDLEIDRADRIARRLLPAVEGGAAAARARSAPPRGRSARERQAPATIIPSTRRVGTLTARRNSRSSAAARLREHVQQIAGDGDFGDRRADPAILDDEARGAAAVIAGDRVDALPDQFGDVEAAADVADQRPPSTRPGDEVDVGRARARRPAAAARGMAGRRAAELARRGAVEQPADQHSVGDEVALMGRQALAVERLGAEAAGAMRIVADRDSRREHPFALMVEQEAGPPGDRGARDRAEQMADEAGADPGSNTIGIGPLLSLAGSSRATARSPASRPIASAASRSS